MTWTVLDIATCVAIIGIVLFKLYASSYDMPEERGRTFYALYQLENNQARPGPIRFRVNVTTPKGNTSHFTVSSDENGYDEVKSVEDGIQARITPVDHDKQVTVVAIEVNGNVPAGSKVEVGVTQKSSPLFADIRSDIERRAIPHMNVELRKLGPVVAANESLLDRAIALENGDKPNRTRILIANLEQLRAADRSIVYGDVSQRSTAELSEITLQACRKLAMLDYRNAALDELLLNISLSNYLGTGTPLQVELVSDVFDDVKHNKNLSAADYLAHVYLYLSSFEVTSRVPPKWQDKLINPKDLPLDSWKTGKPGIDYRMSFDDQDDGKSAFVKDVFTNRGLSQFVSDDASAGNAKLETMRHGRLFYEMLLMRITRQHVSMHVFSGSSRAVRVGAIEVDKDNGTITGTVDYTTDRLEKGR